MTEQPVERPALRYDSAPARQRHILTAVGESGFISVADLTRMLGVSDMTVRRDLRKLEQQGEVRVVHGGVSALQGSLHSAAFVARASRNEDGKRRIGQAAARRVGRTDTIAIDAGTTAYAVVQALPNTYRGTAVTQSVPVMQQFLARGIGRLVGLGGELLPDSQAFVGPMAVEAARRLRVQTLFLGAAGADERGIYLATDAERPTKLALMEISDSVVLVVDFEKFSTHAPVLLADWSSIDAVVTDRPLPAAVARQLAELTVGAEVV